MNITKLTYLSRMSDYRYNIERHCFESITPNRLDKGTGRVFVCHLNFY